MGESTGKTFKGQQFVPVKTEADVQAEIDAQKPYAKEGAVAIETYFAMRGHRDPVMQASMLAYTKVRKATVEDFDVIFQNH